MERWPHKICIIVPVYNAEPDLPECIESILSQSYTEIEVILVDDGSTDRSPVICDEYAERDRRVKVIHQDNSGVSVARNVGIAVAQSEWITFVDSDDFISPDFIGGLYEGVSRHPDVDFVQAGCQTYTDGKISVEQSYEYFYGNDPMFVFRRTRGLTVSKLFRRSIIEKHGIKFDQNMRVSEDQAFTFDYIYHIDRYAFVTEIGYYYRFRPNSLSHNTCYRQYGIEMLQEYRHLYLSIYRYINHYQLTEDDSLFRRRQNAERLYYTISHLYLNKVHRDLRLKALNEDFTIDQVKTLRYLNSGLKAVILWFYIHGKTRIFDLFMKLMYFTKSLRANKN